VLGAVHGAFLGGRPPFGRVGLQMLGAQFVVALA
jgi:hypothetical protein